ncbi:uncharacterized protein LOC143914942 isoform X2 [Arctopsyche grandis]|uniref:uncharacterized protein LOC143914942 isoform X2 n=1 Tax=Arctopsyche grandis TaxID=121162 RepID=UPI00406D8D59
MSSNGDASEFPNESVRDIMEQVVRKEGVENFTIKLEMGSTKGDNYLGVIHRATVRGDKDGEETTIDLIMKTPPMYERTKLPIGVIYEREIYCYKQILPTLTEFQRECNVPDEERFCFVKLYSADTTSYKEVLVMEDLRSLGYTMCDRRKSLDYEHMMLVIKDLAHFHALSFKMKHCDMEKFKELAGNISQGVEFSEMFEQFLLLSIDKAIEVLDNDSWKDKMNAFKETAYKKLYACCMPELGQPYTVLCHGDCWTNNILFKYENDKPVSVRLLDWQMVKETSPVADIAYLMFSSGDGVLREQHYDDLLNLYHETLSLSLSRMGLNVNDCYPKSAFNEHLRVFLPFGLMMGCITAPLFLMEGADIPDMNEMLKKDEIHIDDLKMNNINSQNMYKYRVQGMVKDFINLNVL